MSKKTVSEFINELTTLFPEISAEVLDEDIEGLISLQIGCFRRYTQNAIDHNQLQTVSKCFRFAESCIDSVDFEVENSIAISWAARIKFEEDQNNLYSLLPPKVKAVRQGLLEAYDKAERSSRHKKPDK
ncbi:MAG TPA: hypothetical protein VIM77_01195 [Mucilaginibacter sp.]